MIEKIQDNYRNVLEQMERAAISVGRSINDVRIVVVTKGHSLSTVKSAVKAGIRCFGENYPQEGLKKIQVMGKADQFEWHMIGHIQSRKAQIVSEYYDYVHSIDRLKIARRLNMYLGESGRRMPVLLELNVSGEESKYGFPAWSDSLVESLFDKVAKILEYSHLDVRGLMTMAPFFTEAEPARPYFRRLVEIRNKLQDCFPNVQLYELSMGMSSDFEVAIQEGATWVRIGTAILGERENQ